MFEAIWTSLKEWNTRVSERAKLQHAYVVIAIIAVLVAGLVSLLDAPAGRSLLNIALAAIIIYFVNAVVWGVVNSAVTSRFDVATKPHGNGTKRS